MEELPLIDQPEIFGMHENANLAFQMQETLAIVTTILDVQPRMSSGGTGKSNDDIVYELADSILGKLMDKLDIDQANQEMFEVSQLVGTGFASRYRLQLIEGLYRPNG